MASKAYIDAFIDLIYNQPRSLVIYFIVFFLSLDLKLNILIDLKMIYKSDDSGFEADRLAETIIGKKNVLTAAVGLTNLLNFIRDAPSWVPISLISVLLIILGVVMFELHSPTKITTFSKSKGDSELKVSNFTRVLSVFLHYFDYIFILASWVFFEAVTCVPLRLEEKELSENLFLDLEDRQKETQVYQITISTPLLNKQVNCRSSLHILMAALASVMFLTSGYLKYISHKLMSNRPNPQFPLSKFGSADNLHSLGLMVILVVRVVVQAQKSDNIIGSLPTVYQTSLVVFGIDLVSQLVSRPFYLGWVNSMRLFESVVGLCVSMVCLITLSASHPFPKIIGKQYPVLLFVSFSTLILHRIVDNVSRLWGEFNSHTAKLTNKQVLYFTYRGMQFVDEALDGKLENLTTNEFQQILFDFLAMKRGKARDARKEKRKEKAEIERKSRRFEESRGLLGFGVSKLEEPPKEGLSKDIKQPFRQSNNSMFGLNSGKDTNFKSKDGEQTNPQKPLQSPDAGKPKLAASTVTFEGHHEHENPGKSTAPFLIKMSSLTTPLPESDNMSKSSELIPNGPSGLGGDHDDMNSNVDRISDVPAAVGQGVVMSKDSELSRSHEKQASFEVSEVAINSHKPVIVENFKEMMSTAKKISQSRDKTGGKSSSEFRQHRNTSKNKSKYTLLDSIGESKASGIKFPIVMIDELLSEYLSNLLENPSVEFSVIEEILFIYVYMKMIYLGSVYQMSIVIRQLEQRITQISRGKRNQKHETTFQLLYAMLSRHMSNNLQTGNLIFPSIRQLLTFQKDQDHSIQLFDCATFINTYSDIKDKVNRLCTNKADLFHDLLVDGANFQKIYENARAYHIIRKSLRRSFREMIRRSMGKFTPLMMIYGNYLYHVEQDLTSARKVLKNFLDKQFFFDLRSISNIDLSKDDEMMTIGVSYEKQTFHRINMVSCNAYFYLEYDAAEIIGKDLSVLIPDPLAEYHSILMQPDKITGVLFENKKTKELSMKKKNGYITTCQAVFRMNYRVNSCLEVFAALIFDKETFGQKNLMVVDEQMMVTEVSEVSTDYFEKKTYIYQYSEAFSQIFSDLNYVSNFRLKIDKIDLNSLMSDKHILQHLHTYFEFVNGERVKIQDKNGIGRVLDMKVSVTYMPSVRRFVRFIEYDIISTEVYYGDSSEEGEELQDRFKLTMKQSSKNTHTKKAYNFDLLEPEEVRLKMLLDNLEQSTLVKPVVAVNFVNDPSNEVIKSNPNFSAEERQNDRSFNPLDKPTTSKAISTLENSKLGTIADLAMAPQVYTAKFRSIAHRFIHNIRRQIKRSRLSKFNIDSNKDVQAINSKSRPNPNNKISKKDEHQSKAASSSIKLGSQSDTRDQNYITIIRMKVDTLSGNIMFILLILVLLFAVVFQVTLGYAKYTGIRKMNEDIEQRVVAIDMSTSAIFSVVSALNYMDTATYVHKGQIPVNLFEKYGTPNLLTHINQLKSGLKGVFMEKFFSVDIKMINISYPSLLNPAFDMNEQIGEGFALNLDPNTAASSRLTKQQSKIRKLIFYTQPYCDMYLTRDDLIPPSAENIAYDETVRKNLAGDVLGQLIRVSEFISQYFIDICKSNLNNIYITELEAILSLVATTLIVGFYAMILRFKMKSVYLLLFDLKVTSVH